MAKKKVKTKTITKPKVKTKAKLKVKAKTKLKTKVKAKANVKTKPKSKSKLKSKRTINAAKKAKSKRTPSLSKKSKSLKTKEMNQFSAKQKSDFLVMLEKIINIHKSDKDGLKSLTHIQRILDKYNQNFTDAHEKFDEIVRFGMTEDPSIVRKNVYVPVIGRDKKVNDIYKLLTEIGKGKIEYADVKVRIKKIYQDSLKLR